LREDTTNTNYFYESLCLKVWQTITSPSIPSLCEFRKNRAPFLPKNHREHAHGETAVWHVQKLRSLSKRQFVEEKKSSRLQVLCFTVMLVAVLCQWVQSAWMQKNKTKQKHTNVFIILHRVAYWYSLCFILCLFLSVTVAFILIIMLISLCISIMWHSLVMYIMQIAFQGHYYSRLFRICSMISLKLKCEINC